MRVAPLARARGTGPPAFARGVRSARSPRKPCGRPRGCALSSNTPQPTPIGKKYATVLACARGRPAPQRRSFVGIQVFCRFVARVGVVRAGAGGGLCAVLGRTGSGKTTLLTILAGLTSRRRRQRRLTLDGAPHDARTAARVGFVPQVDQLFSTLTVLETLEFAQEMRNGAKAGATRRACHDVLAQVGLERVADQRVGDPASLRRRGLSGGERKRRASRRARHTAGARARRADERPRLGGGATRLNPRSSPPSRWWSPRSTSRRPPPSASLTC